MHSDQMDWSSWQERRGKDNCLSNIPYNPTIHAPVERTLALYPLRGAQDQYQAACQNLSCLPTLRLGEMPRAEVL